MKTAGSEGKAHNARRFALGLLLVDPEIARAGSRLLPLVNVSAWDSCDLPALMKRAGLVPEEARVSLDPELKSYAALCLSCSDPIRWHESDLAWQWSGIRSFNPDVPLMLGGWLEVSLDGASVPDCVCRATDALATLSPALAEIFGCDLTVCGFVPADDAAFHLAIETAALAASAHASFAALGAPRAKHGALVSLHADRPGPGVTPERLRVSFSDDRGSRPVMLDVPLMRENWATPMLDRMLEVLKNIELDYLGLDRTVNPTTRDGQLYAALVDWPSAH